MYEPVAHLLAVPGARDMPAEQPSPPAPDEASEIKCVVWDLDNTIWQGTLLRGDDVVLTPGVRAVIEELDRRGILQSVASKNDHDLTWTKVTEFGLAEFFLFPQISWANKSDSIRAIAEGLGLGLAGFAFVDDQAFERDEVKHALPQLTAIDAADIATLLELPRMHPRFATEESRRRRSMYQADLRRKQLEAEFPGAREDFLETLGMCLTIRDAGAGDLHRAAELTLRTSQLNTTGRFYSHEELTVLRDSPDHLLLAAELDDVYGTSGIIGLALIERQPDSWLIKLLITSCRVISRGIGGIMITWLLRAAQRRGVRLRGEFVPNDRNRLMYLTYRFQGFDDVATVGDTILLEHDLANIRPFPRYVTVRSFISDEPADWEV